MEFQSSYVKMASITIICLPKMNGVTGAVGLSLKVLNFLKELKG